MAGVVAILSLLPRNPLLTYRQTVMCKTYQMKHFLSFAIILFSTSCCNPGLNIPSINKYFNAAELKELNEIVSFVDNAILDSVHIDGINQAYHYYIDSIAPRPKAEPAFDQNLKYSFLFSLDQDLFNKIWHKDTTSSRVWTRDTVLYYPPGYISIELKGTGPFIDLIEEWGLTDDYYKHVHQNINETGTISPTVVAVFFKQSAQLDFNDVRNRLWAAILLLSLEESVEKKVNRYINKEV